MNNDSPDGNAAFGFPGRFCKLRKRLLCATLSPYFCVPIGWDEGASNVPIASRRTFLREVGLTCSAGALMGPELMRKALAQTKASAIPVLTRVYVDNRSIIA